MNVSQNQNPLLNLKGSLTSTSSSSSSGQQMNLIGGQEISQQQQQQSVVVTGGTQQHATAATNSVATSGQHGATSEQVNQNSVSSVSSTNLNRSFAEELADMATKVKMMFNLKPLGL